MSEERQENYLTLPIHGYHGNGAATKKLINVANDSSKFLCGNLTTYSQKYWQ